MNIRKYKIQQLLSEQQADCTHTYLRHQHLHISFSALPAPCNHDRQFWLYLSPALYVFTTNEYILNSLNLHVFKQRMRSVTSNIEVSF